MRRKTLVLRGPSGVGKSRWKKKFLERLPSSALAFSVSADDFFKDEEGNYVFDPMSLDKAHQSCFRNFMKYLLERYPQEEVFIIVDNTNTRVSELSPYATAAESFGWEVEVITLLADPAVCYARNQHRTPAAIILAQHTRTVEETPAIPRRWNNSVEFVS